MNKTNHPKLLVPSKKVLSQLHYKKMMSGRQIAESFGVSQTQIRRWFKERDIVSRSRSESQSGRPPSGKKNWNWKNKPGYQSLHKWVRRWKGTPQKCEHCGRTDKKKYEWANVSKKYRRDLNDWIRLCTSCHSDFDKI